MPNRVPLKNIFNIEYGNQLNKNKLLLDDNGVNFVSRTSKNLGIDGKVGRIANIQPYPKGLITVTLGGTYLLSSFVQPEPFYTAQNIKVLRPKQEMSFLQKIFYCYAITQNRFRYTSHGREANKTLDELLVPSFDSIPKFVNKIDLKKYKKSKQPFDATFKNSDANKEWYSFKLRDLFEIKKGKRLTKAAMVDGETPFIGAIDSNNGYRDFIAQKPNHRANTITVNYNGSVAEAFYQPKPFRASDDVNVLYPKFQLNRYIGLFITTLIRLEKYRFNYGRKWHLERMQTSTIRLPVNTNGDPDWEFMERYIKSLPYSVNL